MHAHLRLLAKLTFSAGVTCSATFFQFPCRDGTHAVTAHVYSPASASVVRRRRSLNTEGSVRVTVISPASTRLLYVLPGTRFPFSSSEATVWVDTGTSPGWTFLYSHDTPSRPLRRFDTFVTLHSSSVGSPENFAFTDELRTTV